MDEADVLNKLQNPGPSLVLTVKGGPCDYPNQDCYPMGSKPLNEVSKEVALLEKYRRIFKEVSSRPRTLGKIRSPDSAAWKEKIANTMK